MIQLIKTLCQKILPLVTVHRLITSILPCYQLDIILVGLLQVSVLIRDICLVCSCVKYYYFLYSSFVFDFFFFFFFLWARPLQVFWLFWLYPQYQYILYAILMYVVIFGKQIDIWHIVWILTIPTSALQSKNAVCAFQITCKLLSFNLEDFWRNKQTTVLFKN